MAIYLLIAICLALSLSTITIYRAYFHPLSNYPGPFLWSISLLPQAYHLFRGHLPREILKLHDKYGPVVRIASNELSFTSATAWEDIYSKKPFNKPQLQKDHTFLPPANGTSGLIFETDDIQHSRLRLWLFFDFFFPISCPMKD